MNDISHNAVARARALAARYDDAARGHTVLEVMTATTFVMQRLLRATPDGLRNDLAKALAETIRDIPSFIREESDDEPNDSAGSEPARPDRD